MPLAALNGVKRNELFRSNLVKNGHCSGGTEIELEVADEHVAADQAVAEAAGLTGGAVGAGLPSPRSGVLLSAKSSFGDEVLAALQSAGALRPVFRHGRAVLVALPEVRVEYDDLTQREAAKKLLASDFNDATISVETEDQLTLKPRSGDSRDALKMANEIFEHAHPAASSVRFVQFIPPPGTRR